MAVVVAFGGDALGAVWARVRVRVGIIAQNVYDFLGQPVTFPIPLGPGATVTMTYAADHIREALRQQQISGKKVRPYVTTGHGRIEGKRMHLGKWIEHLHH